MLVKGTLRYLVRFDGYEQFVDADKLRIEEKDRTMNITMTINNMNADQALHMAKAAATISQSSELTTPVEVKAQARTADAPAPATRIGPPPPRVNTEAAERATAKPVTTKPTTTKGGATTTRAATRPPPPPPSEAEAEVEEEQEPAAEVEAAGEEEEGEEEEKPRAKANGHANGTNGKATTKRAAELPPEVVGAKKLKDVLAYLIDQGITDPDELKAKCAELKAQVPVLQRITALDERIDRTIEVMEMGEDVS